MCTSLSWDPDFCCQYKWVYPLVLLFITLTGMNATAKLRHDLEHYNLVDILLDILDSDNSRLDVITFLQVAQIVKLLIIALSNIVYTSSLLPQQLMQFFPKLKSFEITAYDLTNSDVSQLYKKKIQDSPARQRHSGVLEFEFLDDNIQNRQIGYYHILFQLILDIHATLQPLILSGLSNIFDRNMMEHLACHDFLEVLISYLAHIDPWCRKTLMNGFDFVDSDIGRADLDKMNEFQPDSSASTLGR
ncbi:hypothetical protein BDA99DRAFT_543487 [Phascolomyces articulosus]|uniref:Uncharacterized protein n=1 Tax=Phascolomyces articulosus TaxID=60185 RepID=A0AAD5JMJ9_9FUNG|nr:hypothetical protein BDA99DRAFT_543487 [Phascolomyces articulosus]